MHTTETLRNLQNALATFHNNKSIFVDLGVREHFNFPKLHSLTHYVSCIESLGTTDNYNTEYTERLHIDLAKDAYRATNHKDEYSQMTLWLERKEKVLIHQAYINRITMSPSIPHSVTGPDIIPANQPISTEPNDPPHIHMSKTPSVSSVDFNTLVSDYGAIDFRQALTVFIASYNQPSLNRRQLQNEAYKILLPFKKVPVFHKIKVWNDDPQERIDGKKTLDVIHCHPGTTLKKGPKKGTRTPARFDTALIDIDAVPGTGVAGIQSHFPYDLFQLISFIGSRVGQICAVFRIPPKANPHLFGENPPPGHLAYVEWFTNFTPTPDQNHGLYKISWAYYQGKRLSSIIEVSDICRSVHLFPQFGEAVPRSWTPHSVLEDCTAFFVNALSDRHCYLTVY
jgi:hypothetical protein